MVSRYRYVIVVIITLVTSAASSGQGIYVTLSAWPSPVLLDSLRQDHRIAAHPGAVYSAVQQAFGDLGLPVANTDSKVGIIATGLFERSRRIADAAMARSFNCGDSSVGAPNADTYRLSIAVAAWVRPDTAGGTALGLAATASGVDASGARRGAHGCFSTGGLEEKIVAAVNKRLRSGPDVSR